MTNAAKIVNRREFAVALANGGIEIEKVSIKLQRIVTLWLSRNEIKESEGKYILA